MAKALGFTDDAACFDELLLSNVVSVTNSAKQNMRDPSVLMAELVNSELELNGLTQKQKEVVNILKDVGSAGVKEVAYFAGVTTAVIKTLEKKGIVHIFDMPVMHYSDLHSTVTVNEDIILTEEQNTAYNELCNCLKKGAFGTALLYGVTGSGKTSVFLKLVDKVIKNGKSVIVMVPEISLTPQTISKFKARYGDRVAVFHSAMSLGQRMEEWKRAEQGKAVIAVGTRSAVFAPLKNLGLIVMDEEQEHTYKSEQSPRFHARDVAKLRCKYNNALLLLASATPSVESYSLAKQGKYKLLTLKDRYGNAVLPKVETVDMRSETLAGNIGILSRRMTEEISFVLKNKKQAILLLNRRGHNTFISCPACGHVMNCKNCSISLTYHSANKKLMCHYCGASHPVPEECPVCKNKKLRFSGVGTQRAFEEISAIFPSARILRLDADTTMTRNSFEKGLTLFANGEYDILLGTQMVAKGLDFPNVTLVGVLSADQSLYSDDFKAAEKTFSLLTQVIGRSGRGESKGLAIVQTYEPDNDIIALACKQDYDGFYDTEILSRKLMIYPPYCDIVMLGISSLGLNQSKNAAYLLFEDLKSKLEEKKETVKVIILGPSPATIPKVNLKYRYRIILKTKNTAAFKELLNDVIKDFYIKNDKNTSVFVDINPESIM